MGASQVQGLSVPSAVGTIGAMPAPETSKLAYPHPGALVKLGRGDVMGQQWDLGGVPRNGDHLSWSLGARGCFT